MFDIAGGVISIKRQVTPALVRENPRLVVQEKLSKFHAALNKQLFLLAQMGKHPLKSKLKERSKDAQV